MIRSLASVPEPLDTVIGDRLDAAVRVKHRWRLRRLGHPEALAPPDDTLWAGAPVPLFHPTRAEVRETVEAPTRQTKIRCKADPREHPFHCHHEKFVVIDGEVALVGGIDMTDFGGDRFDLSTHPARRRVGWHDVGRAS